MNITFLKTILDIVSLERRHILSKTYNDFRVERQGWEYK